MRPREQSKDDLASALERHITARNRDWESLLARMVEAYVREMSDDAYRDYFMHYVGVEYVLQSHDERGDETGDLLYWNNDNGWVDRASATIFTEDERAVFSHAETIGTWEEL